MYKEVLGGDLFAMSFAEAPEETGMPKDPNLIDAHLPDRRRFQPDGLRLPHRANRFASRKACRFPSTSDKVEEAERLFNGLSAGGSVYMPLDKTFWAERFAMFEDRFGIAWMVNCEGEK